MATAASTTPVDPAALLTKRVAIGSAALLLIILAISISSYKHPMPAQDCSKPYDYPVCQRAYLAPQAPQASFALTFVCLIAAIVVAVILVRVGWEASVVEQKSIVTSAAGAAQSLKGQEEKPEEKR